MPITAMAGKSPVMTVRATNVTGRPPRSAASGSLLAVARDGSSLRGRHLVVRQHGRQLGRHALEYAVSSDERMEQRRRDMHQDQREEDERQIEMRVPEQRMQAIALRQDSRK